MSDWDRENLKRDIDARVAAQVTQRNRSIEFEVLSSEVVLADTGLTTEEIEGGVVGGSRDGGLDGVHVFVNGSLIAEDSDLLKGEPTLSASFRAPKIVVELIQAKESNGFSENAIVIATVSASELLNVDRDTEVLRGKYSDEIIEATGRFITVVDVLRARHPSIEIRFTYCSIADTESVHSNVTRALRAFNDALSAQVYGATATSRALGVEEFVAFLRRRPTYDGLEIVVEELMPHEREGGEPSWVTLVTLKNYINFLTDPEDGSYRDYLFTDNVRAYDASAPVNKEIEITLRDGNSPEFWWLNNGVTIIGSRVTAPGKRLAIDDVQIVNGLQTSESIWQVLRTADDNNPLLKHRVLVRVIPTNDKKVRNKIIRATNSQTPVKAEGLRATSEIQLQIEEFLLEDGYFYDRRRNYYKNKGKPRARIVGIRQLAQALLTWVKFRPDDARARPNDYLKTDARHDDLFSTSLPRATFTWVLEAQSLVESFLAKQDGLDAAERNDLRFLVAAAVSERLVGRDSTPAQKLISAGPPSAVVTDSVVSAAYKKVVNAINTAQAIDSKTRRDQLAKSGPFVETVLTVKRKPRLPKQ